MGGGGPWVQWEPPVPRGSTDMSSQPPPRVGCSKGPSRLHESLGGDPLPSWALLPGFGAQEDQNHPKTGTRKGRVRDRTGLTGRVLGKGCPGGGEHLSDHAKSHQPPGIQRSPFPRQPRAAAWVGSRGLLIPAARSRSRLEVWQDSPRSRLSPPATRGCLGSDAERKRRSPGPRRVAIWGVS